MRSRWTFLVLLALAITGAPFGMGRMMDTAHAGHSIHASQQMSGHHGHDVPTHKTDAPHYVTCAACAAATVDVAPDIQLMVLQGTLQAAIPKAMAGIISVPLTPPPRA
jgi:hypothetical protein